MPIFVYPSGAHSYQTLYRLPVVHAPDMLIEGCLAINVSLTWHTIPLIITVTLKAHELTFPCCKLYRCNSYSNAGL